MKTCTKCNETKPLDAYRYRKDAGRYVARCRDCIREQRREYRKANSREILEYNRKYTCENPEKVATWRNNPETKQRASESHKKRYWENPEHYRKLSRTWRESNPDKARDKWTAWAKANPDKVHANDQRRRARIAGVPSDGWTRREVFESAGLRCFYCGEGVTVGVGENQGHADHFTPLVRGGHNTRGNVVCSCRTCNLSKGSRGGLEFIRENIQKII